MAWSDNLDPSNPAYNIAACEEPRIRVIAGPGTGKSFAMKRRVARLLEEGIKPREILALTFTRVAAEDLHRELMQLGVPGCEELQGRTLHSLGLQILSRHHVLAALGRTPRPLNGFEERAMICDLAQAHGGKKGCKRLLSGYLAAWAEAQGDEPGFVPGSREKAFADDVVSWLKFHRAMLIGEIVPYLLLYLKHNPAAPERSEFKHVLIDEYQDLNKAEQKIIEYLGEKAQVCIVGDDDQSVYSFKHAHPEGIREWHLANPGAADHALSECQRCPTQVVEMANALIAHNNNRAPRQLAKLAANGKGDVHTLQFASVDHEAKWIAAQVKSLIESGAAEPGEIIVLVQRAVFGKQIIEWLRAARVPARSYYDESQLDSDAAQERFALFKLFLDQEDRPAMRYLLGVGSPDMRAPAYAKVRAYCDEHGMSPRTVMLGIAIGLIEIKNTSLLVARFDSVRDLLAQLEKHAASGLPAFIDCLFPDGQAEISELRTLALECLERVDTPESLRDEMMAEITQPEIPPPVDEVRVMSLHKSKGLSSPYVFVAGCVQGVLPKLPDRNLPTAAQVASVEEQRRLFYVAITRVKSRPGANKPGTLFLTYCQQMGYGLAKQAGIDPGYRFWGPVNLQPSMFIAELGPTAPKPKVGPAGSL